MRRFPVLLLAAAASGSVSAVAQVNLNAGLVAYYPFTGNAGDSSGNGNNAVVNSATLTADRNGVPNRAYYFNGQSSYLEIPTTAALGAGGTFSLCAQFKPMGFYYGPCHGNTLISRGTDADFGSRGIRFDESAYTNGANCSMPVPDTLHQRAFGLAESGRTPGGAASATAPFIVKDAWYCVVLTQETDSLGFYLNGVLLGKTYHPATSNSSSSNLFLGKLNDVQYPYWFKGVMDNVRIYNRALNASEAASYCAVRTTPPQGLQEAPADVLGLYPNPVHGLLSVEWPPVAAGETVAYQVLNTSGQVVAAGELQPARRTFSTDHLPAGTYSLRLAGRSAATVGRFVKD